MLCEDAVSIPFDLKNYGVGIYKDNTRRSNKIEQELMKRFKEIASNLSNPDNPFLDFAEHSGILLYKKDILKVNIVDNIEDEKMPHPPRFYREVERTPRHNIKFSNHTVFTLIIELLSYSSESISLLNTELAVNFNSQKFTTNKIYNETTVLTSTATVSIRSDYKKKFTIEPKKHYQFSAAFILDEFIPPEINEIEGSIQIEDMYGNKHRAPEFKLKTYAVEPEKTLLKMKLMEKFGEGSNEFNWRVRLIEEKGSQAININKIM